jgi:hypothetical protein
MLCGGNLFMTVATYPAIVRNGKVELATPLLAPEGSEVYVVVPTTMTAHIAKRKVNGWLISEVGNMLMADHAVLLQTEQDWVWRLDVFITALSHEPWGPIGTVDVNTATGHVINPEQTKALLYQNGRNYQNPL